MKIEKLINLLDNNIKITNENNEGLLIWPVVRFLVLQHLIDKSNSLNSISSRQTKYRFDLLNKIIFGLVNNPFFGPKKNTLIFSSSTSYVKSEDNIYYNRITDYFYELDVDNSWKIDEDFNPNHKRKYSSYSKFIIVVYIELLTKFNLIFQSNKEKSQRQQIERIINNINESVGVFNIKIEDKKIKGALLKAVNRMHNTYFIYKRLFKYKKIKKIIIEDGYYGSDKALIIKAARDNNILVIEPQHGFVNENHPSYNYGTQILKNINFKEYYPNFFLSYGEFWSNSVNLPNKTINIGNPHLEKSYKNVVKFVSENKVLVIGSGVTIKETNDLLLKLVDTLPKGYALYYRPHPQESKDFLSRYKDAFMNGVLLDNEELYNSLAKSEIIIGELTTVIFEATVLNKKIYLYNSSYTKAYYNERIKYFNFLDFNNITHIYKDCKSEYNHDYYWSMGWENAFKKLMHYNQ